MLSLNLILKVMEINQKSYIQMVSSFFRHLNISQDVADFIGCQFALESAFGKSDLAVLYNNHCGMRVPHNRITTQCAEINGFGSYKSPHECAVDYCICLSYNRIGKCQCSSLKLFKKSLQNSGYCPEQDYLSKIESIYNQFIKS